MLSTGHKICGVTSSVIAMSSLYGDSMNLKKFTIATSIVALSTLVTSRLADMDSDTSAISKKIPILKEIKSKTGIAFGIVLIALSIALYCNLIPFNLPFEIKKDYLINFVSIVSIITLARILVRIIFAHREGTHTLIINIAFYLSVSAPMIFLYVNYPAFHNQLVSYVLFGLFIGLASHLLFDCCTKDGCPLFKPFCNIRVSFLPLRSGKDDWIMITATSILAIVILQSKFPNVLKF